MPPNNSSQRFTWCFKCYFQSVPFLQKHTSKEINGQNCCEMGSLWLGISWERVWVISWVATSGASAISLQTQLKLRLDADFTMCHSAYYCLLDSFLASHEHVSDRPTRNGASLGLSAPMSQPAGPTQSCHVCPALHQRINFEASHGGVHELLSWSCL